MIYPPLAGTFVRASSLGGGARLRPGRPDPTPVYLAFLG